MNEFLLTSSTVSSKLHNLTQLCQDLLYDPLFQDDIISYSNDTEEYQSHEQNRQCIPIYQVPKKEHVFENYSPLDPLFANYDNILTSYECKNNCQETENAIQDTYKEKENNKVQKTESTQEYQSHEQNCQCIPINQVPKKEHVYENYSPLDPLFANYDNILTSYECINNCQGTENAIPDAYKEKENNKVQKTKGAQKYQSHEQNWQCIPIYQVPKKEHVYENYSPLDPLFANYDNILTGYECKNNCQETENAIQDTYKEKENNKVQKTKGTQEYQSHEQNCQCIPINQVPKKEHVSVNYSPLDQYVVNKDYILTGSVYQNNCQERVRTIQNTYKEKENNKVKRTKPVNRNEQITSRKNSTNRMKSNTIENRQLTVKVARSVVNRPIKQQTFSAEEKPLLRPLLDWDDYHRLDTIHTFMDNLESDFPSICTTATIGKSWEGRDLKILKISNSNASNTAVWIDAGIHAREWIAPATNTYIANNIARNFNTLPEHITNKDWYFLPVMNPDGYEYSHTTDRMWRKNRAWHRGQCVGVDLNRNFSYGFGCKGSSENPTHSFYHGPEPFSEPESTAVKDVLINSNIRFSVYLTLHSYGQVIVFPFAFQDQLCPGYIRLLEGATCMSKAIYNTSGNTYRVGISRDVMYGAAGTSNDFSYGVAGIPFCYLLELRSKKHRFRLPKAEIQETGEEILNSVFALMEFVDNYTPPKIETEDSEESIQNSEDKTSFRLLGEDKYVCLVPISRI